MEASSFDWKKLVGKEFPERVVEYNKRDLILYALGVGAKDLRFIYELHDQFSVLPSYLTVLPFNPSSPHDVIPFASKNASKFEGIKFDPSRLLHADEEVEIFGEIPKEGRFRLREKIVDVLDKGTGCLIYSELNIYPENSHEAIGRCFQKSIYFIYFISSLYPKD